MKYLIVVLLIFTFLPVNASAEIEKIALPCEKGICFYWWPKLPTVKGWHHDRDHSYIYSANAQAPDGFTFANAESVVYAKALYKPRIPETKSLDALISDDKKQFLSHDPNLIISETTPLTTADGHKLKSYTFFPKSKGNWEQVSYCEEGDFYLIFTISSRSKEGYKKAISAYQQFIGSYKLSNANENIKSSKSQTETLKTILKSLNTQNPEKDVYANLTNQDLRFICICGYACYAPGVEKADLALTKKYGTRCLDGTSDVVEGDEHGKLIETARTYAEKYNNALLMKLKSEKDQ